MIILPERNAPRGKALLPLRRCDWQQPSQRPRTFGEPNYTRFVLVARDRTGRIAWRGQFEDREDADAFLFALALGTLGVERELWKLPSPYWPDLDEDYTYQFYTIDILTSSGNYSVRLDYNSSDSAVYCVAGGGSGGCIRGPSGNPRNAAGGGGGEFALTSNLSMTLGGSIPYTIGAGGAAISTSINAFTAGNAGTNTTFNTSTIIATGGGGGNVSTSSADAAGGAGGTGGTGSFTFAGGAGGTVTNNTNGYSAAGGGGAGGVNGVGAAGTTATSASTATNGGQGDNGTGGSAGSGAVTTGGAGGAGSEFSSSGVGSGGGGGASYNTSASATGGSGGSYGGGGGGCSSGGGTTTSGAGKDGVIVVVYAPYIYLGSWFQGFTPPRFDFEQVTH